MNPLLYGARVVVSGYLAASGSLFSCPEFFYLCPHEIKKKKKEKSSERLVDNPNSSVGKVFNTRVESETVNKTSQKTNKRGKTKLRSEFTEKSKNTDLDTGEVTTTNTRQVDKGKQRRPNAKARKKQKFKQVFKVYDKEGKLLVKQKDKNRRSRVRVTRRGRKAGY